MSRKTKKRKNPGGDNSDPPLKKQPVQSHSAVTHVDNATTGENSNVTPDTTGQKAEPANVKKDLSVTSKMGNISLNEPTISVGPLHDHCYPGSKYMPSLQNENRGQKEESATAGQTQPPVGLHDEHNYHSLQVPQVVPGEAVNKRIQSEPVVEDVVEPPDIPDSMSDPAEAGTQTFYFDKEEDLTMDPKTNTNGGIESIVGDPVDGPKMNTEKGPPEADPISEESTSSGPTKRRKQKRTRRSNRAGKVTKKWKLKRNKKLGIPPGKRWISYSEYVQ